MSEDEARWTGYIPKGGSLEDVFMWRDDLGDGVLCEGYFPAVKKRGPKSKWDHDGGDWPPDKVEIIVRRVKG